MMIKKEFVKDMQNIYKVSNLDIALEQLEIFDQKLGKKYGYGTKPWKNNIEELTPFFEFLLEIRRIIYTINLIEVLEKWQKLESTLHQHNH